ncbi:MAG: DsrE family protein [Pseudomonadota bacterium]|jgi:intracellular sulfur oxidation DsrE/DsrF family protein
MNPRHVACAALLALGVGGPALADAPMPAERPMLKVDPEARYKVVYDISSGTIAAGISRGLYYARGLIEAYGKQGVTPDRLDIHLVLHGDAALFLLNDDAYQKAVKDPFAVNLNARITQDLLDLGVSVEICHSVMRAKGWKPADVLPGVSLVHDGYTRLVKLQNDGYAYISGF